MEQNNAEEKFMNEIKEMFGRYEANMRSKKAKEFHYLKKLKKGQNYKKNNK